MTKGGEEVVGDSLYTEGVVNNDCTVQGLTAT